MDITYYPFEDAIRTTCEMRARSGHTIHASKRRCGISI
jgi:hypothetical protein